MIEVRFQNDKYSLPSCWDDLTTQQFESLAKLVKTQIMLNELLFRFALSCMGMRMAFRYKVKVNGDDCYYIRHGITRIYLVSPVQMGVLADSMSWVVTDNSIKPTVFKNPYPEFSIKRFKRLFGPAEGLTNITLNEWMQIEVERDAWEKTQNNEFLNRMLAVMWRPTTVNHPDGDKRAPLRQDTLDDRAKRMAKVPDHKKQVMIWFYTGCISFISAKFSEIFSSNESGELSTFDGFMQMVNDLAKNDLTKIDKVRESPLYEALYNIQSIMKQNEANTKKHENAV
jgi:hypothetical protein